MSVPLASCTLAVIVDGIFWMAQVKTRGIPRSTLLILTGALWLFILSVFAFWWYFIPFSVRVDAELELEYRVGVREAKLEVVRSIPILASWMILISAGLMTPFWFFDLDFFVAQGCLIVASFTYFFVQVHRVGCRNIQLLMMHKPTVLYIHT